MISSRLSTKLTRPHALVPARTIVALASEPSCVEAKPR
jgi:hypothetical protein